MTLFLLGVSEFHIGIYAHYLDHSLALIIFQLSLKLMRVHTPMQTHTGLNLSWQAFKTNVGHSHLFAFHSHT